MKEPLTTSGKRVATTPASIPANKSCQAIKLDVKLDVIRGAKHGEHAEDIGRALVRPPTTVRTIVKNSENEKKVRRMLLNEEHYIL